MPRQSTDPPKNNKDMTWQKRMNDSYKGKPRKPGRVLPEGTYSKSPSEIAHILKMHSDDYKQASSKLNSYINRSGRELQGNDRNRLYEAKEALKRAYGVRDDKPKTTGNAWTPFYADPLPRNDDQYLNTGIDDDPKGEPYHEEFPMSKEQQELGVEPERQVLQAATRLIKAEKWVKDVKPKHGAVPEGTFEKSAEDIAKTLKRVSDSHKQASSRLSFYRNRAGENLSKEQKDKLAKAADILRKLYE